MLDNFRIHIYGLQVVGYVRIGIPLVRDVRFDNNLVVMDSIFVLQGDRMNDLVIL